MMFKKDNFVFKQISDEQLLTQCIRNEVLLLIHRFFPSQGFTLVDPPILHEQNPKNDHEIKLPIFNGRYSLNSGNALYMGAYASLFKHVYAISPTFRDEQQSVNHLLEFRMLEVETLDLSFADLPAFIEKFIVFILKELITTKSVKKNEILAKRIDKLLETFHPRTECYNDFNIEICQQLGTDAQIVRPSIYDDYILRSQPSNKDQRDGHDRNDDVLAISKLLSEPVFITDYPRSLATWTAMPKNRDQAYALNLILPGTYGELCEGCERTNDIDLLQNKMRYAGISSLQWYLEAIGRITVPRCGFGIGVDRLVRWIIGLPCVQDTVLFPRIKS